ncbi:MAG: hypothetical protein ACKOWF_09390 [Chloroflexota bacterium]
MAARHPGRAISRRLLAACSFLLAVIGFGAINLLWAREYGEPRVILLGAGNRLSALVTSGHARVLIATGDDPAAAANALNAALRPTLPRLDVLIAAGNGADLAVPAALAGDPDTRLELAIAPFARPPDWPALQAMQDVGGPRRLNLPNGVAVTIESADAAEPSAPEPRWAWRAVVERGASRVVVLSDGDAAGLFSPAGAPNVLAVSGGEPLEAWREYPAPLLAFGDEALPPGELRDSLRRDDDGPDWTVRVFPGEAAVFHFIDGGVESDPGTTMRLSGTPAAE